MISTNWLYLIVIFDAWSEKAGEDELGYCNVGETIVALGEQILNAVRVFILRPKFRKGSRSKLYSQLHTSVHSGSGIIYVFFIWAP